MSPVARSSSLALPVVLPLLLALGCAPAPKNLPCSNAADCRALGEGYEYCLESRCVRCLSKDMCEPGELCVDGQCLSR